MSDLLNTLSTLILLSSFVLMAGKRTRPYIRAFRFQSALIALTAGIIGMKSLLDSGRFDVLIVCILIVVLKVVYIPNLLSRTYRSVEYRAEKDFILNIPLLVVVCCALVVLTYVSVSGVEELFRGVVGVRIVNSISVILIGLFFMISRKSAIGQITGFLVIENGLFITAMFATEGMPFVVDMGIFIDLITAVLIMGLMVFRISDAFESVNLSKLRNLKG
jgi:hydrogenase-4 component E